MKSKETTKSKNIKILLDKGWHMVEKNSYRNSKIKKIVWCHGAKKGSFTYMQAKKQEGL